MNNYENAIEIHDVTKMYDGFKLDDINITLPKGCIMGLIGPNGAGKTTLIKSLLNIIGIDLGNISVFGLDHIKHEIEIKERIAVIFDDMPFNEIFTAEDLSVIMEGIYPKWNKTDYIMYLKLLDLPEDKKIKQFSKGMKMKLQIACALSHDAELIIMDEPTAGIDTISRDEVLSLLREYMKNGERSILMSTHITSDLERAADMVTLIDNGKVILTGNKDELLYSYGIIKCSNYDAHMISRSDVISKRFNSFGAEVMVKNREKAIRKYKDYIIDPAGLDDIMMFFVHREAKEWF